MMSIRRFAADPFTEDDLVENGTLNANLVELLRGVVRARLNVVVSGGTGAGKTTLLNVLSRFVPATARVVTIEDAADLQLKQGHVIRLETRPANLEGKGRITARDLVINALRMRPDRIIVGEVRGSEALDMLQAMNTGHDGSLTTVHANSPRDALSRIETMVAMTSLGIPVPPGFTVTTEQCIAYQDTHALSDALKADVHYLSDLLNMIKTKGKEVIYDAEHFFDLIGKLETQEILLEKQKRK